MIVDQQAVTGRVTSGDVEIFYRKFGKPGHAPIVIVHGLSFFSYDWTKVATLLAQNREVAAIDMRGFGDSGWSPARDYKLETLSNDVIAVLDALGWDKAILMGHSFGGRVCLATAGWKPERTAALVLVDFAPDLAAAGRKHVAERIGRQPDVFASVDEAMTYHHDDPNNPARRARWEAFLTRTDQGYVLKRDLHHRDNFKRALEGNPSPAPQFLWPMLGALTMPTLVIRGSSSDMFAAETMDKVRTTQPAATVAEVNGSHDLAGDNPSELAGTVGDFLAKANL
ncbi:MAG: alpha/beta fold hydrolase [Rhodopseudomonas sp.]|nr:alpha/beta fold hydrolase [Rhodopseudomonas sp.]